MGHPPIWLRPHVIAAELPVRYVPDKVNGLAEFYMKAINMKRQWR